MKKKIQIILLSIFFVWLFTTTNANTSSIRIWTPGVCSGDYFTYEMYGVYTSNHSNITIRVPDFEKNNTDWVRITIFSTSSSIVYQVYTLHYLNGNEISYNFQTDVNPQNQGTFRIYEKGVPICSANLNSGDCIPTAELILNETITRTYLSCSRETNHASWNFSDDWGDIYFDRETGMLVELCRTHKFGNLVTDEAVEKTDVIKLIATNRWHIASQQ